MSKGKKKHKKHKKHKKPVSWRQAAVDRLEAFCGLNPQALGKGPISGGEWWVNALKRQQEKQSP